MAVVAITPPSEFLYVIGRMSNMSSVAHFLSRLTFYRICRRLKKWHSLTKGRRQAQAILSSLESQSDLGWTTAWAVHWAEWTGNTALNTRNAPPTGSRILVAVGPADGQPMVILRLPGASFETERLQRQQRDLAAIHAEAREGAWRRFVPRPVATGSTAGQFFAAEQALPGRVAQVRYQTTPSVQLLCRASEAIQELHRQTASSMLVDAKVIRRWVDDRLQSIQHVVEGVCGISSYTRAFGFLATELNRVLYNRSLNVGWVHGDFWLGNVLIDPDSGDVTGIVDWDRAGREELPAHDYIHLLLVTRMYTEQGRSFGEVVHSFLSGAGWTADELCVLNGVDLPFSTDDDYGQRMLVLLCWIRRMVVDLNSVESRPSRSWIRRNSDVVLSLFTAKGINGAMLRCNASEAALGHPRNGSATAAILHSYAVARP